MAVDLTPLLEGFPGEVSVFARNLDTGALAAVEPDVARPTASAAKQFILLTFADGVSARAIDPDARVELTAESQIPGSGVLRFCAPGLQPTLMDLAYLMMTVSDNVAANLLLEAVGGPDSVGHVLGGIGIVGGEIVAPISFAEDPLVFARSTARALAESFALLADPSAHQFDPKAAKLCLDVLRRHQHLEGLPRLLPWNWHAVDFDAELPLTYYGKSGSYPGVCTDAGLFVTRRNRYAVAVMCDELTDLRDRSPGAGPTLCARIGEALYDAWGREPTTDEFLGRAPTELA